MYKLKNSPEELYVMLSKGIDTNGSISGYASVFDVKDYHGDIVTRGAFQKSISDFNDGKIIPLLWQHTSDKPIGIVRDLIEDEYGLYIKASILTTIQCGREALELIRSKVICGFSIGYTVKSDFMDHSCSVRILKELELWEISVVTFPANSHTSITNF